MTTDAGFDELLRLSAVLWAGELEVVETYFRSPARTPATDVEWLRRQCYKELWGSGVGDRRHGLFMGPVEYLREVFPRIDRGVDRHAVLAVIDDLRSEFHHYCLFADIHDAIAAQPLDPQSLASWPADEALARMRYAFRDEHPGVGAMAVRFTEGGHGTLYLAGMRLAGNGGIDEAIARACATVHADEAGHMGDGVAQLRAAGFSAPQWRVVHDMVARILRQRLHMRNEQFGFPVPAARLRAIEAGDIEPLPLALQPRAA